MTYSKEKHLKLVEQALNWEKQDKVMFHEDPKADLELTRCEIPLEDHIFWTKKTDFVSLMQNYINNSITFEEFETKFSSLWWDIMKELDGIRRDLERLKSFYPNPESERFGSYITAVFRQFEELDDEVITEQEARDYIIHIINQIQ